MAQEINSCTTPDQIDRLGESLSQKISREWERLGINAVDYCKISFQGLYQTVMERVEEYSGIRSVSAGEDFKLGALPALQRQFQTENYIERLRNDRHAAQAQLSNERENLQRTNSNIRSQEGTVQNLDYAVGDAQRRIDQKQNEIRNMGARPEEKVWYEDVAVERSGFFGWIADCFSTKYEQQERRDDSERRQWDNTRKNLQAQQNSLTQQLDETRQRKQAAEKMLRQYKSNAQDSAERICRMEERIQRLAEQERLERERLEKEKTLAKENYVRMCKSRLREQVAKYFHDDGATEHLLDELKRRTADGEQKIFSRAADEFQHSITQKLAELEQARQGNLSTLQKKIEGLELSKRNLERYAQLMEERLHE